MPGPSRMISHKVAPSKGRSGDLSLHSLVLQWKLAGGGGGTDETTPYISSFTLKTLLGSPDARSDWRVPENYNEKVLNTLPKPFIWVWDNDAIGILCRAVS